MSQSLILITDDDPQARKLVAKIIRQDGHEVVFAANGQEALSIFEQLHPDVVLMDAVMPQMNGFEACARLKALPGGDKTPVLMLTSLDDDPSIEQAFAAGATDYIPKPIRWSLLRQRIAYLVRTRRAETALDQSEEQLSSLLAHAPLGICVLDTLGVFTLARGQYGNVGGKDLLGRNFRQAWQDCPKLMDGVEQALRGEPANSILQFDHQQALAYSFSPTPQGVLVVITDISERLRLEQLQQKMQEEKIRILHDFISGVSHDLRTPISSMTTALYLLENQPQKLPHYTPILKQNLKRLARLVDDMLTLSRLDLAPDLECTTFDLNELVTEIGIAYQESFGGIPLRVELCPHALPVYADRGDLHKALGKLLDNARDYSPNGGGVLLQTSRLVDETALIRVQDSGIGIAAADLPHVFERFFRAAAYRPTDVGGAGLGLTIAQKIVELHQGAIMAESQLGQGSVFYIRLPLVAAAD